MAADQGVKFIMAIVQPLSGKSSKTTAKIAHVLIISSSDTLRKRITQCLDNDNHIQIEFKPSSSDAVISIQRRSPDVIVLDVDGVTDPNWLATINRLRRIDRHAMIVMLSASSDRHNVKDYTDGLARGASDFLSVPAITDSSSAKKAFDWKLNALIHSLAVARRQLGTSPKPVGESVKQLGRRVLSAGETPVLRPYGKATPKAVAIVSSTGGPRALIAVLSVLPRDMNVPIFITQHMPGGFTTSLAQNITSKTDWQCHEGVDGMEVLPGYIYLAPGGYHMELETGSPYHRIRITDTAPENFCKPSAEPMLRSLIGVYGGNILLTVLTGMGADGLAGATQLANAGGTVIAQDQATSVVWGMPGSVAANGLCSAIKPIDAMAREIAQIVQGRAHKP